MIAAQLSLKNKLDDSMVAIKVKKDIVSLSQLRNYNLITVHSYTRFIWDFGVIGIDMIAVFMGPYDTAFSLLISTNQKLLSNTHSLDQETRDTFFLPDVRIRYTPYDGSEDSVLNVTTFQAIDRIVEIGLKALQNFQTSLYAAYNEIDFLLHNCLNDAVVKNQKISDMLFESSIDERTDVMNVTNNFIIITISVLALATVVSCVMVWRQYQGEKIIMCAFIRLRSQGIYEVMDNIDYFRRNVENEGRFDEEDDTMRINTRRGTVKDSNGAKREHSKIPDYRRIMIKYCIYAGSLFCFIMILASLMLLSSILGRDFIEFVQWKQNQLFFTNRIKTKVNLAAVCGNELASSNNTSLVKNQLALDQMIDSIEEVIEVKSKVASQLMEQDGTYDPTIEAILFDDGCPFLTNSTYCPTYQQKEQKVSLLTLLSDLETLLVSKKDGFINLADKSFFNLFMLEFSDFDTLFATFITITDECVVIADKLDDIFERELVNMKTSRNIIFGVSLGILVIMGILVWIFLLRNVKEVNNDIKKVLQTLPAEFVLSSFILKTFLMNTSRGALDSVKSSI